MKNKKITFFFTVCIPKNLNTNSEVFHLVSAKKKFSISSFNTFTLVGTPFNLKTIQIHTTSFPNNMDSHLFHDAEYTVRIKTYLHQPQLISSSHKFTWSMTMTNSTPHHDMYICSCLKSPINSHWDHIDLLGNLTPWLNHFTTTHLYLNYQV